METIIFSPHVDDEVIGCFSWLNDGRIDKVYYFFELSDLRKEEAIASSKRFGFKPFFVDDLSVFEDSFSKIFNKNDLILVPNIKDHHIHHKMINRMAKFHHTNLMYYSIDMNVTCDVVDFCNEKKESLYSLFPSQERYFNQHRESFLFEKIIKDDYLKTYRFLNSDKLPIYYDITIGFYDDNEDWSDLSISLENFILDSQCPLITDWCRSVLTFLIKRFYNDSFVRKLCVRLSVDNLNFIEMTYGD